MESFKKYLSNKDKKINEMSKARNLEELIKSCQEKIKEEEKNEKDWRDDIDLYVKQGAKVEGMYIIYKMLINYYKNHNTWHLSGKMI